MEKNIIEKIQSILNQETDISEDQTRSLMILLRKCMELMSEAEKTQYATLNLFCNWSAHIAITQSITGLRTLRCINDALVRVKDYTDLEQIQSEMSEAIGFNKLLSEFIQLFDELGLKHQFTDKRVWGKILGNIIEIIRDVPLSFPTITKLKKTALKIYTEIAKNPIKPGAGVVLIKISKIDYSALGVKNSGEILCLLITTEDTIKIVIPLVIKI
ncbi:MAG: hypothetical protein V1794_10655 [Candidatus Glassbacteria bacterium]